MPRIRTIKPEFWADEKIGPMDAITRLVFLGLISMADDAGRVIDSIRAIDGFIFPQTEDSCRESIEILVEAERLERGITASGQAILQIVNWHHQKIDKPNLAAAFPGIAIADPSAKVRRSIPPKIRDAIFARDGGKCKECGTEVRRNKRDKYDSGPDLAEIDHIIPHVEGGSDDPQNLRLTCLSCNRKKAGADVIRRNADRSATNRRQVADESAPVSVPTISTSTSIPPTNNTSSANVEKAETDNGEVVPLEFVGDLKQLLQAVKNPEAWSSEIRALRKGLRGKDTHPNAQQMGQAIRDYLAFAPSEYSLTHFRRFVQRAIKDEKPRAPGNLYADKTVRAMEIVNIVRTKRRPGYLDQFSDVERRAIELVTAERIMSADTKDIGFISNNIAKALAAGVRA